MPPETEKQLPRIRTFRTDSGDFMKERNISELDVASSAYISRQNNILIASTPRFSKKILIIIGALIAIGGITVVSIYSRIRQPEEQTPAETPIVKKFVAADQEKIIAFTQTNPGSLNLAIEEERSRPLKSGSIVQLLIPLTMGELFTTLHWAPPRAFLEETALEFNAFVAYGAESANFALIIPIRTFEQTLAALLEWERTMWIDWKPFMNPEYIENIKQFQFQDEIIRNNDARVLVDSNKTDALGYTIFNKKFVVVATSREALSLILAKLIALPPR